MADKFLNDVRARGGRAQARLAHCLAQFLVLHQFTRSFHRTKQRSLSEARRWARLLGLDIHIRCLDLLAFRHRRERLTLLIPAINRQPTRLHQHLAFGLERFALHARNARCHQKFRRRIKHRQEPLHHQVVNFLLLLLQSLGFLQRGDDRKVIGDFCIVENPLVSRHDPVVFQHLIRKFPVTAFTQHTQCLFHSGRVILRQRL